MLIRLVMKRTRKSLRNPLTTKIKSRGNPIKNPENLKNSEKWKQEKEEKKNDNS